MVANKYAFLQITRRRFLNEWEAFKKVISRRNIRRRITIPLTLSNLKLLRRITRTENLLHFFFSSRRRHTRLQGDWSSDVCSSDLTQARLRPQADAIFLEAMGVLGVSDAVKYTLYWAVRLFGGLAWYRNAADRAAGFDRVLPDVHLSAVSRSERRGTLRRVASHAWGRIWQA